MEIDYGYFDEKYKHYGKVAGMCICSTMLINRCTEEEAVERFKELEGARILKRSFKNDSV